MFFPVTREVASIVISADLMQSSLMTFPSNLPPLVLLSCFLTAGSSIAQSGPTPVPPRQILVASDVIDPDIYYVAVSGGAGAATESSGYMPTGQFAASAGLSSLLAHNGFRGMQDFVEAGVLGPLPNRSAPAAFVGFNLGFNKVYSLHPRNVFFTTFGIDYVFREAGALNAGIGFDHFYKEYRAIRYEIRDYLVFTDRPQNTVALRVGWVFSVHNP